MIILGILHQKLMLCIQGTEKLQTCVAIAIILGILHQKLTLVMKACVMFDEILSVVYFLNGLSILDVKFANLAPRWRHLYGRDDW